MFSKTVQTAIVFSLFVILLSASLAAAGPQKVIQTTQTDGDTTVAKLENGLTVIIKPHKTAPVVCVQGYVRTGGMYEGKWLGAGVSHLLEHLVAKGAVHESQSGQRQTQQTTGRVAQIGGQSNAYTSMDKTCYYISAASSKTDDCIELVADWLARPDITEEDFNREHGVVQRELEMGKDEPARRMWYANSANIFQNHPAGVPVIGYAQPLSKLTHQDVIEYHSLMYTPQNMVFVVVGDIDPEKTLEKVCSAFADFNPARAVAFQLPKVPPVAATRIVTQKSESITQTQQSVSFQTIPLVHEDLYALDVLSYILTNGDSSILVKKLQQELKLVTSVSSSSWTPAWGKGVFSFSMRSKPENAIKARSILIEELTAIKKSGATEQQLAKAKRQKIADLVYSQQTAESIASTLASDYLSTGDIDFSDEYTERIQSVTAEQVQQAADKYFEFDKIIITEMVPQSYQPKQEIVNSKNHTKSAAQLIELANGTKVVLYPTDAVDLVSFFYTVKGGILCETPKSNGLGTLMCMLATRGTKDYSADQIAQFFDSAGGSIAAACGNNTFYWEATVLSDSADEAFNIFTQTIFTPTFPSKELDIVRPQVTAAIKQIDEKWSSQMMKFFKTKFFADSPYAMQRLGTESVVEKATAEQLAKFHHTQIFERTGEGVLCIYGNFDADKYKKTLDDIYGARIPRQHKQLPDPPVREIPEDELHLLKTSNKVAAVVVGTAGMHLNDLEDRLAMTVLDTIISGYRLPAGWLHEELRGQQLVYVVHAFNQAGLAQGAFVTYAAGQPDNAPQIVEIIKKNLRKTLDYTPTQEEIDLAVNTILTAELLDTQSMSALAMDTALNELYGFGYEHRSKLESLYRKITPEDVKRVAKKYLSGRYVVTVTTPQPEAFDKAEKPAESTTQPKE